MAILICPTCSKQHEVDTASQYAPFCSRRCQLIDLGRWMNEEIRVPHIPSEDEWELREAGGAAYANDQRADEADIDEHD